MNLFLDYNMSLWLLCYKQVVQYVHTSHGVVLRWRNKRVRFVHGRFAIVLVAAMLAAAMFIDTACLSGPG